MVVGRYARGTLMHFDADRGVEISARNTVILFSEKGLTKSFVLPRCFLDIFGWSRILSRAFRLDRVNLLAYFDDQLVLLRQGKIYVIRLADFCIRSTYAFSYTRNILAGSSAIGPNSEIVMGDYGGAGRTKGVSLYRSSDRGLSWEIVHKFPVGKVKQVLNIEWDELNESFWVSTGDEVGECYIWRFNSEFDLLERLGDGGVNYRAISLFIYSGYIAWVTNNPRGASQVFKYEIANKVLYPGARLNDSIWYSKTLVTGEVLLTTAVENSSRDRDQILRVLIGESLSKLRLLTEFKKDSLPFFPFRFGLGYFPSGRMYSSQILLNLESVKTYDGETVEISINE